jgi:hypothetical protein
MKRHGGHFQSIQHFTCIGTGIQGPVADNAINNGTHNEYSSGKNTKDNKDFSGHGPLLWLPAGMACLKD